MSEHVTDNLRIHCQVMAVMVEEGIIFKASVNKFNQYVIEFTGGF